MSRIEDIKASTARKNHLDLMEYAALRQDYQNTFGTAAGKRVLLDLMGKAHFFRTSNTGNSGTYSKEGAREFMLMFQGLIPGIMGEVLAMRYQQEEEAIARNIFEETQASRGDS